MSPAEEPATCFERQDEVGIITFNRPQTRNAMGRELLEAFVLCVDRARAEPGLRALVLTGRGTCFSAGADLRGEMQRQLDEGRLDHERSYAMYEPFLSVLDVEVPVIAALNGHAVGGGFGLSLLADIRIGNEAARYGANFARLGIHSGLGISYLLPRLVGVSHAAELLFTGTLIDGRRAAEIGLFSTAVPADQVLPRAMTLATEIAASAPIAVRGMKRSLYRGLGHDVRGAAYAEAYAQAASLGTADAAEGVTALLEKRPPRFIGK